MSAVIKDDLFVIKEKYGENMMHLCRNLFSTILETPGLLSSLMLNNFEPSRFLYNDIMTLGLKYDFANYIKSLSEPISNELLYFNIKRKPSDLLAEAGYTLYECKNEEDIQLFKKYYAKEEELCTFNGGRLKRCLVFFAVHKDVDNIRREDFKQPERQDRYGTSVLSIQFTRSNNSIISIKNRYNHTVDNPDATFSNNLDNIIPGLTGSFSRYYNLNLSNSRKKLEIPGYIMANNGKYYKYNYEINNIYYGPNNIIIDNFEVIDKYRENEKYLIIDYFVIDLINKKIELYDNSVRDCFCDELKDIKKINIIKNKSTLNKTIEIFYCNIKTHFLFR